MEGDELQLSLKAWLETNLVDFLTRVRNEITEEAEWKMPVVEDYILVISVKDLSDNNNGVFAITDNNSSSYRIRGLLDAALD